MKVKKYVAPSMPEAMKKIRAELGKEAVILNSKVIHTGGFLGFFTKKNIEVIAAIDPSPFEKEQTRKEMEIPRSPMKVEVPLEKSEWKDTPNKNVKENPELIQEIDELKRLIKGMNHSQQNNVKTTTFYPEELQIIDKRLIDQEIDDSIRGNILSKLVERWYKNNADATEAEVTNWLHELLFQMIQEYKHGGISFTKKFVNVVGPTGVGKTTSLAKIAAECVIKHHKKVAFITTDTYRIAAIDQLKTYAKILNVPIEVCYNLDDFVKAKEKFEEYDLVFIDTAGRNFRNQQYVEDLKEVIDFTEEMETFLVLSLTAKQRDMMEIYKQFSLIDINRFIFTKVDETSQYGSIVNLILTLNKGVAYLTIGQNVPDDIIEATPTIIVNTVLGVDKK
ncbi:flagellar biosynthesis protein FlhF [Bacillus salitolerans]|uniref:Flagellar biosynthesis protein FlhF n=1 Tax=Bacillus salitolerans TaxID=1437434 RepID=A0ABW4LM73_9BACI